MPSESWYVHALARRPDAPSVPGDAESAVMIDAVGPVLGSAPDRLVVGKSFGDTVLSCLHRGHPVLLRVAQAPALLHEHPADPRAESRG
ncbi:hypothetical protein ACIBCC_08075 [Streptomyces griseus]|uniref:hypothetical protein n=1 Tax=Streptomyces TaxID=1883 RepID=UPI001EFB8A28|nr:hypothetical protein [Streptomyces sp. OspMP-M43]